jgi:hypothetical protein
MPLVAHGHCTYSTSNVNDVGYEQWYPEYAGSGLRAPRAVSLGPTSGLILTRTR